MFQSINTYIDAKAIKSHKLRAGRALATYHRTKAYRAALFLTSELLSHAHADAYYQSQVEAGRYLQLAGQHHATEQILQHLLQFAFAFLEALTSDTRELDLREELGRAFIRLIPQRQRGGSYIKQRTRRVLGEMLEETVWSFCFRCARLVKETEAQHDAALKESLGLREEIGR